MGASQDVFRNLKMNVPWCGLLGFSNKSELLTISLVFGVQLGSWAQLSVRRHLLCIDATLSVHSEKMH